MNRSNLIYSFIILTFTIILLSGCDENEAPVAPVVDHIAPAVEWISPESGVELTGTAELAFSVYDEGDIDRIKVYRSGFSPEDWQLTATGDTLYTLEWNTIEVDDGVYILEARAWDVSGNLGTSPSLVVNVRNGDEPPPEDRLPPDIWWAAPDPGSTLQDSVVLICRFFDESSVDSLSLSKNGALVMTTHLNEEAGEYEYRWNTLTDSDGVYVWEARAWDAAGNMGTSPALLVRVKNNTDPPPEDNSPPVISWLSPQPGDTLEGTVELRFQALDDVGVDSVKVYLNGREWQNLDKNIGLFLFDVTWITNEYPDGNYIVQVKAWDCSQNVGMSEVIWFHVWNNRPRVIWVPDDYDKIQDAINASQDGDTVRVRAGTYYEGLRLMGKNIWLESEEGPEVTVIDGDNQDECIEVWDGEQNVIVRGFKLVGDWKGITAGPPNLYFVYNCIFVGFPGHGVMIDDTNSEVYNCIFDSCVNGVSCAYSHGKLRNSIFIHCELSIWENAIFESHLDYGWSLFWDNQRDYNGEGFDYKESDVRANPQFIPNTYILSPESPAINAGDPLILDTDGSCSDIGIYGGPYSYPIP